MTLFCERFGLTGPVEDSVGCEAIQSAIAGKTSIASLRSVLEGYSLYRWEAPIMAILDELTEVPASVTARGPEGIPAPEPSEQEDAAEPPPTARKRMGKRK